VAVDLDQRARVAEPDDTESARWRRREIGRCAGYDGERPRRKALFLAGELALDRGPQRARHAQCHFDRILDLPFLYCGERRFR